MLCVCTHACAMKGYAIPAFYRGGNRRASLLVVPDLTDSPGAQGMGTHVVIAFSFLLDFQGTTFTPVFFS